MWLIATITLPEDTRPAVLGVGGGTGWVGVGRWVAERVGRPVTLEGVADAVVWIIREGGQR
jgi:hypothetical protein